ncbi:hypothetical protein BT63DRAFT_452710 [Microthyrium microscopicum]|uniref:Uncharacterized protein n=1 Tax=Microthyrium microscopicum TaxID=703497 RepID=A0A6A6UL73_9PEZI|nr:hypothetical protein BT63DRAFT_452710 [Microthyrium microscopicum]
MGKTCGTDTRLESALEHASRIIKPNSLVLYAPHTKIHEQAKAWAKINGKIIYDDVFDKKCWLEFYVTTWSRALAKAASGTVYIFIPPSGLDGKGTFTETEWGELVAYGSGVDKIQWIPIDESFNRTKEPPITIWDWSIGPMGFPRRTSMREICALYEAKKSKALKSGKFNHSKSARSKAR